MTHPASAQTIDVNDAHVDRYTEQGWRPATVSAPPGNASLSEWQDFARDQGFTDDQIDGKSRDELRAALS
jgi:hypothetical protein